jgi:adenine-specific DNA-methyltransferase
VLNDDGDFVGFDVVIGNPPYIRQEEFKDLKPYLKSRFKIYNSIADLLTYFVELSYDILKSSGNFQFIISNKFTRANYGSVMRKFLLENTSLTHFIDFSGVPVFDEATVDAAILGYEKQTMLSPNFIYANIPGVKLDVLKFEEFLKSIQKIYKQKTLTENAWAFENQEVLAIKQKIESQGIPLKHWNITINYGIKTGLNEAFVIDESQKNKLISQDNGCKEFIKPLLRGRDINKYAPNFQNLYLIYIPKGFTIKNKKKENNLASEPIPRYGYIEFDEAWDWFKKRLPSLSAHLLPFKSKAEKRIDKGDYWWEQRACAYLEDFKKLKIIYKDIAQKLTFMLDNEQYYTNNTNYFITGNINLDYLTAVLNSSIIDYYYRLISTQLGLNAVRLFTQFVELIPIPLFVDSKVQKEIVGMVLKITVIKKQNPSADTTDLETQIDQLVYQLYDLTEEEIAIVEGSGKKQ